jgi:hypothetical protein
VTTENIEFTPGQFRVLLNKIPLGEVSEHLALALHQARLRGGSWVVDMTRGLIEEALGIFESHHLACRDFYTKKYLRIFVSGNGTAQEIYDQRKKEASA